MTRPLHRATACFAGLAILAGGHAMAAPRTIQLLPDAPPPETARIVERPIKDNDVFYMGTLVDGTHTTVAGGRGSLAVGLMFGPLGVAANAAHAHEVNVERSKTIDGLVHNDTIAAFKAIRQASQPAPADTRAYELVPIVQVLFEDDKTFRMGCMVTVTLANPGKRDWRARYSVQLPGRYDNSSPASLDAAAQTVAPCLAEANRLFEVQARGGLVLGTRTQPVEINGKTVQMLVADAEYPAHAVIPDMLGAAEWPLPVVDKPVPPCACNGAPKPETGAAAGG